MENPETVATLSTQDTGQINVRENRMDNQEWPVSCVLNAASVSGLSILNCPLGFL
jgi:hypothetical protein